MGKKIVLVGADAAPSRCFMRLEPVLKERGFDVELIVGDGKPLDKSTGDIMGTVSQANIIFLGMSAPDVAMPEKRQSLRTFIMVFTAMCADAGQGRELEPVLPVLLQTPLFISA